MMSKRHVVSLLSALLVLLLSTTGLRAQYTEDDELFRGWSPDGRSLLYRKGSNAEADLYMVNRDGTNPQQLTQWQTVTGTVFSPDSRSLALKRYDSESNGLYLLNLDDKSQTPLMAYLETYYPAWSPDSRQMLVMYVASADYIYNVMLLDTVTGDTRDIIDGTTIEPEYGWSADGNLFFVAGATTDPAGNVLPQLTVYHADGTAASENLLANYLNRPNGCCYIQIHATFSPDSKHLVVSIAGDNAIYDIDLSDATMKPVGYVDGYVTLSSWSADGTELHYRLENGEYDPSRPDGKQSGFHRLNLVNGQSQPEFIFLNERDFVYGSPDRSQFAIFPFPSGGTAAMKLTWSAEGDPIETKLTYSNMDAIGWSPDGTAIAATLCVGGDYDVYVFDVATGRITNVTGDDTVNSDASPFCGGFG